LFVVHSTVKGSYRGGKSQRSDGGNEKTAGITGDGTVDTDDGTGEIGGKVALMMVDDEEEEEEILDGDEDVGECVGD